MPLDLPDHLERMLTRLKPAAIRDQPDSLLDEAGRRELTIREALTLFCDRAIARKERAIVRHRSEDNGERRIGMSFGLARFPFGRDLAGFDCAARPSIDRGRIRDLATGRFVANGEAVLLPGPPGVGKTHLAVATGREVIVAGYTVLFVPATTLVAALAKAQAGGRLEENLAHVTTPKLPIVDELGCLPFEPDAAHLFFQLVSRRSERGAMPSTSNRAVGEWGRSSAIRASPPPSSTACCTAATPSPSAARATACAKRVGAAFCSRPLGRTKPKPSSQKRWGAVPHDAKASVPDGV